MDYITSQYLIDKGFSKEESRKLINKARTIMELEKYYVPKTKPRLALKTVVNKILKGGYQDETTN